MNKYLKLALKEAQKGMHSNDGGPFGAVVVKDGLVISQAHNQVISLNDPTAHAEIQALRQAGAKLGRFDLSDCQIYSTCQPCPMCLAAIYWARIPELYYGATSQDVAKINFSDQEIYDFIRNESGKKIKIFQLDRAECLNLFQEWEDKKDKIEY